jgi:hypothetical protein
MTKFNPNNKEILTYGECLDTIFKITDKADAMQYKRDYVAFIQKALDKEPNKDGLTAEQIANANIGYYAGYGSSETRKVVEYLFECAHPVFGSIKDNGAPTAKEAFEMGRNRNKLS